MANQITISKTGKFGLPVITAMYHADERGFARKSYEKQLFQEHGLDFSATEIFESRSVKNVIRGMHFQKSRPQTKIVRPVYGQIFDVVVDIRRESATFGEWESILLDGDSLHNALYIPGGFAHGFLVLSDAVLISYQLMGVYDPADDSGIYWADDEVGIQWPVPSKEEVLLSEKDHKLPLLRSHQWEK